jgi:hypothetical protein
MRRTRVILLALVATVVPFGQARAAFAPATLVSGAASMQFSEANAPAMAGDGNYAAFQGDLAEVRGVYERDLQSGEVKPVAVGASVADGIPAALSAPDAAAPSVSADGRYVAFTTTADLEPLEEPAPGRPRGEPEADRGCPEVYVRDMDKAPGEPGAYTLVAALDGSEEGITFGGCTSSGGGFALAGAQAIPAAALSADGRHVAFTLLSPSNLTSGDGGALTTMPSQVLVRDLDSDATTLVTSTPGGEPVPEGGAFPSNATLLETPAGHEAIALENSQPTFGDEATASTAALSADASSVAWLGTNVGAQVSTAEVEREPQAVGAREVEPLWRRIADGPHAMTRRLLAGAGLDFTYPLTEPSDPVQSGSLVGKQHVVFVPPALSANGSTVGVIASAPPPAALASLTNRGISELKTDAYAVQVDDNPALAPAARALTEIPTYIALEGATADVKDIAVSPDGTHVAFDTARTQLTLPTLTLLSPPAASAATEIYEADLASGTVQRVSATYDGSEPNGSVGLLSLAAGSEALVFASSATNIFYGDGVANWEVYLTHETDSGEQAAEQVIGVQPTLALPSPEWTLSATATPQSDGSVIVDARVPGAGTLTAQAQAQLSESLTAGSATGARSRSKRREGKKSDASAGRTRLALVTRTVARGATRAGEPAEIHMRISLATRYRALAARREGLYVLVRVLFAAPGHAALEQEIPVTLHRRLECRLRSCLHAAHRSARSRKARSNSIPSRAARSRDQGGSDS